MATKQVRNPDGSYSLYDDQSYTPPTGAKPISVDGLQNPEEPFNVPTLQPEPDYLGGITAIPSVEGLLAEASAPTAAEGQQNDFATRILDVTSKLGGRAGAQAKAETAAGLPGFQSQLTDLNGQIQALQKETLAIPIQIQQQAEGRGVTAGGMAPHQTAALRNNAIKAFSLSAIAQTLQGNISLAQAQADKAVEVEFAPLQAQLDVMVKAYELNKDRLDRIDRQRSVELEVRLGERQRALDEQKENRNIIIGWAAEAAKNGAPNYFVTQALQSTDPRQALSLLGQYFQDPFAKDQALAELEQTRAQTKATFANIAKIEADTALTYAQRKKVLAEAVPLPQETAKQQLQQNEALTLARELRGDSPGKGSAIGASPAKLLPFGQALGLQGNRSAFEARVNTLKSNLTLENLALLKGPMSDKDILFLNSIGSSLNFEMSETQFNSELDRIITKLESAGATPTAGAGGASTYKGYVLPF